MALYAARLAGSAAARYAPRLYGALRASYMRNPRLFARTARSVAGTLALAAGNAVSAGVKRSRSADAKTFYEPPAKKAMSPPPNGPKKPGPFVMESGSGKGRIGSGVYKGRFVRRKKRALKKKKPVEFNTFGMCQKIEEFGEVDDNDTVYVMTPCANDQKVLETLVASLIKKLLMMGIKWSAPSWDEEIVWQPGSGSLDPAGLFINMYGGRPDTTDGQYDVIRAYPLVNGDTIHSVMGQFINEFLAYSAGTLSIAGVPNANTEIYSMVLGSGVRNSSNTGGVNQTLAVIYFDNETVHWKGTSRVKVQNRTNSVTGSGSVENNDAKPLEGFIYEFRGLPRLRVPGTGDFKNMNNGLNTKSFGAATVPNDFKEPPASKIFSNCVSRKKVHLDPGVIKEFTTYGEGSMALKPFLKKLIAEESASLTIHTMFKTSMLALEELINSTDVNAVKVGFENSVTCSVTSVTKKKKSVTVPRYRAINIVETV